MQFSNLKFAETFSEFNKDQTAYRIFGQIYVFSLMPLPKIAVVILNWNGKKFLEQFLPSVLSSTYPGHEVIIADNGSSDDSIIFLEQHYPSLRLIRFDHNLG